MSNARVLYRRILKVLKHPSFDRSEKRHYRYSAYNEIKQHSSETDSKAISFLIGKGYDTLGWIIETKKGMNGTKELNKSLWLNIEKERNIFLNSQTEKPEVFTP